MLMKLQLIKILQIKKNIFCCWITPHFLYFIGQQYLIRFDDTENQKILMKSSSLTPPKFTTHSQHFTVFGTFGICDECHSQGRHKVDVKRLTVHYVILMWLFAHVLIISMGPRYQCACDASPSNRKLQKRIFLFLQICSSLW